MSRIKLSRFEKSMLAIAFFIIFTGVISATSLITHLHSHLENIKELVSENTQMFTANKKMIERIEQNLERNVTIVNSTFSELSKEIKEDDLILDQQQHRESHNITWFNPFVKVDHSLLPF